MESHERDSNDIVNIYKREIEKLMTEHDHTKALLEKSFAENEELKAQMRATERNKEVPPPSPFCRRVADALCEELVLLEEDIAFISSIVKPPDADPYTSNAGRSRSPDNRRVEPTSPATSRSSQPQSASEQLQERNWAQGSRAVSHPPSSDELLQVAEGRDED